MLANLPIILVLLSIAIILLSNSATGMSVGVTVLFVGLILVMQDTGNPQIAMAYRVALVVFFMAIVFIAFRFLADNFIFFFRSTDSSIYAQIKKAFPNGEFRAFPSTFGNEWRIATKQNVILSNHFSDEGVQQFIEQMR
jgi:hypothetical protein